MYLICHVTSHENLVEGSCKCLGDSSLRYFTTLIGLVTIGIVIVLYSVL